MKSFDVRNFLGFNPKNILKLFQQTTETPKLQTQMNGDGTVKIAPASLWTRPKLQEFINHVKRDASSVIVVGRGETVTIRVPTHENGNDQLQYLHNEKALGFLLYPVIKLLSCSLRVQIFAQRYFREFWSNLQKLISRNILNY